MQTTKLTVGTIRVLPQDSSFLDRKLGSRGEIFYDRQSDTLRLYNGVDVGGVPLLNSKNIVEILAQEGISLGSGGSGNTTIINNNAFDFTIAADDSTMRTVTSGNTIKFVGGTGIDTASDADNNLTITNSGVSFYRVSIQDGNTIQASSLTDTMTLVAGANITISAEPSTKTITFTATGVGGSSNTFSTIAVSGQNSVVAESSTDTLNLVGSGSVTITTDSATDTVTISSSAASTFSGLSDVTTASLTVDEIYLPAITRLVVTNSGASAYLYDQYSGNNPTLYAISGTTIAFNLNVAGHPFLIQDPTGTNYNNGLVHVSTTGTVSTGSSAQGQTSGTLYWKVPSSISGNYRYQCSLHAPMVGAITVRNISTI